MPRFRNIPFRVMLHIIPYGGHPGGGFDGTDMLAGPDNERPVTHG
jgi:hypothetical protein